MVIVKSQLRQAQLSTQRLAGFIFCAVLILALTAVVGRAQNITASLTGTVTDSTGAVVPGATVVIHNNATNVDVRTVTTNNDGSYSADLLPYGTYTVTISKAGFQNYVGRDVILHVGDHRALNAQLQTGAITQTVTVLSTTTPVQTSSAAQSTTITGTQIRELQLNNRNFEQLVTLQPGVTSNLPDQPSFGITNTDAISVNGVRTSGNNWTVDGSDVNDSGSNLTLLNVPSIDALQEFTLERSTYDAKYGRSGGAQVNVVTKSGTSQFHGDAYEFFRNDKLDANTFFLNSAHKVAPPFRYNDFGFTLGGPFYIPGHYNTDKSKTFFFWSEEWRRIRQPSTAIAVLPAPGEVNGAFTGAQLNAASAPAGCITNNAAAKTAQINSSCFSKNAQAYIQNIYSKFQPNGPGNEYINPLSAINNYRQDMVRIDQKLGNRVEVFGRYMQDFVPTTEPGGLFAGEPLPGISSTASNAPGKNLVAHITMDLTPTIVNEAAFNYSWGAINSRITGSIVSPAFTGALANNLPFTDPYHRVPGLGISGITGVAIPVSPYHERNIDKEVYDNLSIAHGNHSIGAGVSAQWMRKSENAVNATNGSFSFRNGNGNPAFANFLLGEASSFSQASRDIIPDLHFVNIGAYVQDDWKVRPNLTLNLGVRYSFLPTPWDANKVLDNFDPATFNPAGVPAINSSPNSGNFVAGQAAIPANYANGIIVAQNGCGSGAGATPFSFTCSPYGNRVNPNYNLNFAPRIGFSWDPFNTGKTAIRAGYGIYYDRTLNGIWEQNSFADPPFVGKVSVTNTTGANIFDNPSAGSVVTPLNPNSIHATGSPAYKVPYEQDWSFSVERQIASNTMFEIAYVGSAGTHLLGEYDYNQVSLVNRLAQPTVNVNAIRPAIGYNAITTIAPRFNSNYNSLQVSVNRRVSHGLTLGAAYTYSKTLTNSSTDRSTAPYDTYNFADDYGPANFSVPQIFIANYVYDLPFFSGQQGLVGRALGGWEVSGITTFEAGFPLSFSQFNDPFRAADYCPNEVPCIPGVFPGGIGIDPSVVTPRPDRVAGVPLNRPATVAEWFNTAAFTDAIGHFGTSGRGIMQGPGRNDWDIAAIKNIKISERFSTQFRAEFFNAFNHTSFSSVSTNVDSSIYGRLTGTHDPRIIQLGLKLYF
ncbi:MAG: carboxypeptidase regulatory-like domain-containing protein [Terriglobia bacterium]